MITLTASADEIGITVMAATARAAMAANGGDGEGVGLMVRHLGVNARERLHGGEEDATLTMHAEVCGTEFVVTVRDLGVPVTGAPDGVLSLLEIGVATAADARSDGAINVTEVRFGLPAHHRIVDTDGLQIVSEAWEPSADVVMFRPMVPGDAASLTRIIYRCYGWSYSHADFYYPERIAAALESGERIGEVAVTSDGEVAAHWGAVFLSASVVKTGGTVTDPRFRRRGIAVELGVRLLARLEGIGVIGRVRDPVMTHAATQEIALREGATIIGAYLNVTHPIQQIGITDGVGAARGSLSVAYSALRPLTPAHVWIPSPYESMVRMVLEASEWPRELAPAGRSPVCPERSVLSTSFVSTNNSGQIVVTVVGADLVDAIDLTLHQMRRSGAEYVQVRLPANQPALGTLAAGLVELGLGFAAFIPEFEPLTEDGLGGDALVTQWLADSDIDASGWVFADDRVKNLVLAVIDQARDVAVRGQNLQRRAASRARLFAALD